MKWRDKYRPRDKKQSDEIPSDEFLGILEPTDDFPSGRFLIGDEESGYLVCLWNRERGLYNVRSHDNAYFFAMVEYLLANGAMRFASTQEAEEFAKAQGWVNAQG